MKSEPVTVSSANIEQILNSIRSKLQSPGLTVVLPKYMKCGINHKRYRGKGRPRLKDYTYKKTMSMLKKMYPIKLNET